MSRSRRHGRRKGFTDDRCQSTGKICFTTYDYAWAAVARNPDAVRAYRCNACGRWHITRYEDESEYAQRVARKADDYEAEQERAAHASDARVAAIQRIRQARHAS